MKRSRFCLLILALLTVSCGQAGTGAPQGAATSAGGPEAKATAGQGVQAAAPSNKETVKVEFWFGLGGKLGETAQDFIKRFNASQDEVEVVPVVQPDYSTTETKLQAAIAARRPPALALVGSGAADQFIEAGVVQPLDDMAAKTNFAWDDVAPAFTAVGERDGKRYTMPMYGTTQVMYYRKDFFKQLGIEPNEAFKNWQNLDEAARKCTVKKGGEVTRYGWEPMWGSGNLIDATMSAGGKILSDDGKKVLINDPTWIEVWDLFRKRIHEDKTMRIHYGGEGWAYWYKTIDDVMQGRACGYIGSSGDQGDLDFSKIAAHIQPGWEDHPPAPGAGGLQAIIPAATSPEQQEAAFKFLSFWTQPEMTAEWSVKTGYMPVRLSAIKSPILQEAAKKRPAILVPPQQLELASPEFIDPTDGKIDDALAKAADKVEIEGVPAEQALNDAQKEAQAALDRTLADQDGKPTAGK